MLKNFLISLTVIFVIIFSVSVLAKDYQYPSIEFNREFPAKGNYITSNRNTDYIPAETRENHLMSKSLFKRFMGLSKKQIEDKLNLKQKRKKEENDINVKLKVKKGFELLEILSNYNYFLCTYIIEKQKITGYFLVDYSLAYFADEDEPIIQEIKKLEVDNDFCRNIKLNKSKIVFYKKESNEFIERYGILTYPNGIKCLFLDSFYPKKLDKYFEKELIEVLNFNLDKYNER